MLNLHSLEWRLKMVDHKVAGRLACLGWGDLAQSLLRKTESWPRTQFAEPVSDHEQNGHVRYRTPIGEFCATPRQRESLGIVVMEQLASTYEKGRVRVAPGDVVIDLGANLGAFTRTALNQGAGKVFCFEPNPELLISLQLTFQSEIAQGSVEVLPFAAWHSTGTVRFSGGGLTGQVTEDEGIAVPCATVDDVVDEKRLRRVDFIKADIEGAERHALVGCKGVLKSFAPKLAICTYHLPDDPDVIRRRIIEPQPEYTTKFDASKHHIYCRKP